MTVKATAHSEPRGSLCSTSFQPSAGQQGARWSSVVDDAIKLACAGVAHEARAARSLASVCSGMAAARRRAGAARHIFGQRRGGSSTLRCAARGTSRGRRSFTFSTIEVTQMSADDSSLSCRTRLTVQYSKVQSHEGKYK